MKQGCMGEPTSTRSAVCALAEWFGAVLALAQSPRQTPEHFGMSPYRPNLYSYISGGHKHYKNAFQSFQNNTQF
eukprot:2872924-Amphidinium_carterae.1